MVLRRQECWRKFLGLNGITPSETLANQLANVTGARRTDPDSLPSFAKECSFGN